MFLNIRNIFRICSPSSLSLLFHRTTCDTHARTRDSKHARIHFNFRDKIAISTNVKICDDSRSRSKRCERTN